MPGSQSSKPGLPAERTLLSWERSAFGFLVGGALVLLRQHGPLGPGRTALALAAALLALFVLGLGYRRSRQIRTSPVIENRVVMQAPQAEVVLIGVATAGFATAIVVALLLYMQ
ncbi:MAG: DUF202 domain-containing protein [Actinomycetia bacterium]|nr:DUF202 domain-containing protein [Actinomycetes bacterium]MCH9702401.1 DUF202 domain-containing protein [Actinomycetes bacterium]MCH9759789.1 DUF202 domain-containing protein [Actinomycetes bacterium]